MRKYFLETECIVFRIWAENDIENANLLWQDKNVTKFISSTGLFSDEEIKARLKTEIENINFFGVQYWPFFNRESGEIIGCCGFRPYKSKDLEFGIHIRSKFWRQGYGFKAGSRILSFGQENFPEKTIFAGHNPNNPGSKKLLEKLNFEFSHDEFYPPTGLMHPTYILKRLPAI